MSNPDWNLEPPDNTCERCTDMDTDECICTDTHEPDTISEYLGEQ